MLCFSSHASWRPPVTATVGCVYCFQPECIDSCHTRERLSNVLPLVQVDGTFPTHYSSSIVY